MSGWTKCICKANGIDIHYLRTGGDKPPVVLLHGLMTSGACWTPLARALEQDYDIIMPDARGHGHSSATESGYDYDILAADVVALMDKLNLNAPVILGHSMGGMTAAVIASQNSKRLRGLILADPTFLTPPRQREVYESDVADQHRQILRRSKEDFLNEMRARRSNRSPEMIEIFAQARFQTSIHAFEILRPPNPDYLQLINTIEVPTLLVIGDVGAIVSVEMGAELAKLNQRVAVVQLTHAGHAVPYDQPESFAAAVRTFLSTNSSRIDQRYDKQDHGL